MCCVLSSVSARVESLTMCSVLHCSLPLSSLHSPSPQAFQRRITQGAASLAVLIEGSQTLLWFAPWEIVRRQESVLLGLKLLQTSRLSWLWRPGEVSQTPWERPAVQSVSVQERCAVKEVYTVVLSLGWPACRSLGPGRRILLILSPGNISNILKIFFRSESLRTVQILVISRADPSRDFPSFPPSLSVIKNNFDQSRLTLCGPEQQSKQLTYGHYSSDEGDWTGKESVLDSFLKVTTLISYDATADIF